MYMHVSSGVVRFENDTGADYLMFEAESYNGVSYFEHVGGKMEPVEDDDEEPVEAFLREFHEETGERPEELIENIDGYEPFESRVAGDAYIIYPHDVEVGQRFEPAIGEEHTGSEWMSREQISRNSRHNRISDGRMRTLEVVEGDRPESYSFRGDMLDVVVENFDI